MRAELKENQNTYINTDYFQKILHGSRFSIIVYQKIVEINEVKIKKILIKSYHN